MNNNSNIKNNKKETNPSTITYINNILNIGIHNVRGFTEEHKQRINIHRYKELKYDIIGITETKLNQKKDKITLNNKKTYRSWWTGNEIKNKGAGVGLLIKPELAKHVHNVTKFKGRRISADLYFKGKIKIRIIVLYIHANEAEKNEREALISDTVKLIKEGKNKNMFIILLGDLNADPEKYDKKGIIKKKGKYRIIEELRNLDLHDVQATINEPPLEYTWTNGHSKSRIDQIWVDQGLMQLLMNTSLVDDETLKSDHKIVSTKILSKELINNRSNALEKRNKLKRTIFKIDKMEEEDWEKFQEFMDQKITEQQIEEFYFENWTGKNKTWLNITWEVIEKIIKKTMKQKLQKVKVSKKEISRRPKFTSNTYKKVKWIIKLIRRIKKENINEESNISWSRDFEKVKEMLKEFKLEGDIPKINQVNINLIAKRKELISILNRLEKNLRIKIKSEETLFVNEQIKLACEKRCENFESNKKGMINSITEREINKITIDRLMVERDGEKILLWDEEEIKNETKNHFKSISDNNLTNNPIIEEEWKEFYTPRNDINEHLYKELMSEINEEEWNEVIRNLNRNKAAGVSMISYDVIKKCSGKMKNILRKFANECLKIKDIPKKWSEAVVYPIPKPGDWNLDINKTRPITLLECPRKMIMKVLTNRLSKILSENRNIIDENNYAALPGNSTQEPIHILNNIMEDARENGKELWVLLQDMSKAYDLVNREHLAQAMERIKIPKSFIEFIMNSLKERRNRIITDVGLTDEYRVLNGIDQGEILSPILWIIYYNPLFERIKQHKGIGYEIKVEWNEDLEYPKVKKKLEKEVFNIAYMDDTTWTAQGKAKLEKQLEIADSFNEYNGIKVNPEKSQLIVINSKLEKKDQKIKYGKNQVEIKALEKNASTRFLGVWISETKNEQFVKNQIGNEISKLYNVMECKMITSEQIIYIINAVLIPRIEYRANITMLTNNEIMQLTSKMRKLLRNKCGISNTLPNTILWNSNIYGLIDFYNRQLEAQGANLVTRMNDKGTLGTLMEIRVRQLQENEWLYDCPLSIWNYTDIKTFKNNLIAQILSALNNYGINIDEHKDIQYKKGPGRIPIISILKEEYRRIKHQLRKQNIMYLEQLLDSREYLLEWEQLSSKIHTEGRGKKPNWWKLLEERVLENRENEERRVKKEYYSNEVNIVKSRNKPLNIGNLYDKKSKANSMEGN